MWALGCILGELYLGKPVFPGSSTLNQITRIIEVTGKPKLEDLQEIHSPLAITMFENLDLDRKQKSFSELFLKASKEAIDLISKLLVFRPSRRLNAVQALSHPFLARFHDPEEEPDFTRVK